MEVKMPTRPIQSRNKQLLLMRNIRAKVMPSVRHSHALYPKKLVGHIGVLYRSLSDFEVK